jgi:hypothetical protein
VKTSPAALIEELVAARAAASDDDLLRELAALAPLPDENAATWDSDETWSAAYLLVAMADLIARRRIVDGVGLVLDRMCFGDPGEMMRGLRHAFEGALDPDWARLVSICASRCASQRAGTRYWAVQELGILRRPSGLPAVLALFDDREHEIAEAAMQAATMIAGEHRALGPRVVAALGGTAAGRPELRERARGHIEEIQRSEQTTR